MDSELHRRTGEAHDLSLIRRHARRLARRTPLDTEDRLDIEQELVLHALAQLPRFDPSRGGFGAFLDSIMAHKATDLLKARRALRRGHGLSLLSIHEVAEVVEEEVLTIADQAVDDALRLQRGLVADGPAARALDTVAFARAFAALSPAQQDLCRHLVVSGVSGAARQLGISRGTVQARLRAVRSVFRRYGLGRGA